MPDESAIPAALTATLIALPVGLWAGLVVVGGMLFGPPVLGALALQLLGLGVLPMATARRRPEAVRRDRPRQVPKAERAALRMGPG